MSWGNNRHNSARARERLNPIWLDPPVITRDGETLRIVREHHWDFMEWAICIALAAWLLAAALVIHAAPGKKWPETAPFLIAGTEEWVVQIMLEAMQEHLARQQVQ